MRVWFESGKSFQINYLAVSRDPRVRSAVAKASTETLSLWIGALMETRRLMAWDKTDLIALIYPKIPTRLLCSRRTFVWSMSLSDSGLIVAVFRGCRSFWTAWSERNSINKNSHSLWILIDHRVAWKSVRLIKKRRRARLVGKVVKLSRTISSPFVYKPQNTKEAAPTWCRKWVKRNIVCNFHA